MRDIQPDLDHHAYRVLVVDDEEAILRTFALNYRRDFDLLTTTSPREALAMLEEQPVAVMITDQRMPEMTGVDLVQRALEVRPALVPILLTGYTDVEALVQAINLRRVFRYVPKPWDPQELRDTICQAIETFHLLHQNAALVEENGRLVVELERANERLRQENRVLKQQGGPAGFDAILGRSPALTRMLERARRVAESPATVLIEGPTGTGKELVARAIHAEGPRRERLFVAVNLGTMTETLLASTLFGHRRGSFTGATADQKGLFEVASGGTLFLDEVGEASLAVQVHLLRVLQEGEIQPVGATRPVRVDVRIIAATNRDLEGEVRAGRFREDLLHRLKVFPLHLPPLRERREDIPLLAEHILERLRARRYRREVRIDAEAMDVLCRYDFPGNVRELENLIERALILCGPTGVITEDDLFDSIPHPPETVPSEGASDLPLDARVVEFERRQIADVLGQCGGNKSQTARVLGMTYGGLLRKMQRYGMVPTTGGPNE
jgi:DNA-binding NtrC family response regulator